jgi:hypothetical protein
VLRAEETAWDSRAIRKHAEDYAEPRFRERFMRLVEQEVEKKHGAAGIKALREALGAVPAATA